MFWSSRKTSEVSFRYDNVFVHPSAEVAADVELGQFSYVGPNCRIGDGSRLHNNVTIVANTIIGAHNEVFSGAVIGAEPQDKKYFGEDSWVIIGDENRIRENVTIHGGTQMGDGITRIGNHNLIMASCHIAHDCIIEDRVTIANNVLLGGHVKVEHHASFGGLAAVHHFVSVGQHAFVGGLSRVTQDVPPFMLVEGNPIRVRSLNRVGLKREGFSDQDLKILKEAQRLLFRTPVARGKAFSQLENLYPNVEVVQHLVKFLCNTEQGQQGRARQLDRRS